MTDTSQDAPPPPERSPQGSVQDRGSTVSMTSTTTGLPDRYRPIDQVGPDEPTPTGVIQCWRAKDRVLNRDVAIRVHTPAGPAAHAWISRALTAGGLATKETFEPVARMIVVSAVAGGVGWLVLEVTDDLLGSSSASSLGKVLIGTVVIGGVALAGLVVARVPEVREPLAAIRARTGRG